jgi:hypothetical protein
VPRRRKLTPGYWLACAGLLVAGTMIVWNLLSGLAYPWLTLLSSIITMVTSLWLFRTLWKQQNPLAQHPSERSPDRAPAAPSEPPPPTE